VWAQGALQRKLKASLSQCQTIHLLRWWFVKPTLYVQECSLLTPRNLVAATCHHAVPTDFESLDSTLTILDGQPISRLSFLLCRDFEVTACSADY
jgi:hypothetical protein